MKKEKLVSRRRRALRMAVRAAVILFLVNHFLLTGLLFPFQALRRHEERQGTGRTAVVRRDRAPEVHWSHLIYLTENENVTMLSGAYLTFLGWTDAFGMAVDCSKKDAPLYGGWWSMSREEEPSLFYVFGRVDGPDIARLEVRVLYEDWRDGEPIPREAFSWASGREDWMEKDGRYYFLFRRYPVDWGGYPSGFSVIAIGYNGEGNEIVRRELDQGASSSFG